MDNELYKIFEKTYFNHKYYLKEFKGAGAFGAVFLADEVVGGTKIQEVAIKAIRKDKMPSDIIAKELVTAIRLKHPNLINCITSEEGRLKHSVFDYDCFGLVMEIASGTLEDYLQASRVLPAIEVREIVKAIASGLVYLHGQSVTHRDLKPANVLRVGNVWKISDFGLARQMGRASGTMTSNLMGTETYMPPEVYAAAYSGESAMKVSPAWDIWSLGVMIVEMLTGAFPFDGIADIWKMKIKIKGDLPQLFDPIVQNCLVEDPKLRLSAKEILEILIPKQQRDILPSQISTPAQPLVLSQYRRESAGIILELPNSQKLELVKIPSGQLIMDGGREINLDDEFWMGKYPVTQAQYQAVMGSNPSKFKGDAQLPVDSVFWKNAVVFCKQLSRLTGRKIRLPSETEWEYACRADSRTKYYFGDDDKELDKYAWYGDNSGQNPHPVGNKLPNKWGLYDMHGNVWEWCHADLLTSEDSDRQAVRGGGWNRYTDNCQSGFRGYYPAADKDFDIGFRVVLFS
jgi:serine/threonine protein kinase